MTFGPAGDAATSVNIRVNNLAREVIRMQPIVVGVDFSPASGAAWAWACQLALVTGSELVAVTAVERSRGDRPHKPLDIIGHHVEEWLKEWVET